jgi:hypothetical protein
MTTKQEVTSAIPQPIIRSSAGLRNALFDELDSLRNGTTNPAKANAVAKLADQVIATVKMEMDVQRHLQKMPKSQEPAAPQAIGTIALG